MTEFPSLENSVRKIARKKNRGETCDAVVKIEGSIYNEFFEVRIRVQEENGVREAHEGPTSY